MNPLNWLLVFLIVIGGIIMAPDAANIHPCKSKVQDVFLICFAMQKYTYF